MREDLTWCPFQHSYKNCDLCSSYCDYEDTEDIEEENEDLEEAVDGVFQSGFDYGFKKGYKARRDEELENFEPIDWGLSEEYDEEDEELYEQLYQSGELSEKEAKAFEIGRNIGFTAGLAECSSSVEDNYKEGYKDALLGEPCFIEDEEIEEIIEDLRDKKCDMSILRYDTDFLGMVKTLQDKIFSLHRFSENEDFKREIMDIFHLLTVITENQVMKPVYDYWVKLEELK